jgi:cation diffusion facilitator family transporter
VGSHDRLRPPDHDHAFGHEKIEYFSGGFEGSLILMAAGGIVWNAVPRLLHPVLLEQVSLGAALTAFASVANGSVAFVLGRAAKAHRSLTLEADSHHLMSDVWSSLGILAGVGLSTVFHLPLLDPVIALAVAVYIASMGIRLLYRAASGLLDPALSVHELEAIEGILDSVSEQGVTYHALRSRRAGRYNFVQVHILVPGDWTVKRGHALAEELETRICTEVPGTRILTHLEPIEDPCSFEDIELDRVVPAVAPI